jgi:hypothetical protein
MDQSNVTYDESDGTANSYAGTTNYSANSGDSANSASADSASVITTGKSSATRAASTTS